MTLDSERVRDLLDYQTFEHSTLNPWAEFAEQITVSLELTQKYRHSLGRYSRFFMELAVGKFFGTRCESCNKVYTPPRTLCPECQRITSWQELSGEGKLLTYSVLHFNANIGDDVRSMDGPLILAYVLMDGSDTLFPHVLVCDIEQVKPGMRVSVAYRSEPVSHPLHLMYFQPIVEVD